MRGSKRVTEVDGEERAKKIVGGGGTGIRTMALREPIRTGIPNVGDGEEIVTESGIVGGIRTKNEVHGGEMVGTVILGVHVESEILIVGGNGIRMTGGHEEIATVAQGGKEGAGGEGRGERGSLVVVVTLEDGGVGKVKVIQNVVGGGGEVRESLIVAHGGGEVRESLIVARGGGEVRESRGGGEESLIVVGGGGEKERGGKGGLIVVVEGGGGKEMIGIPVSLIVAEDGDPGMTRTVSGNVEEEEAGETVKETEVRAQVQWL